MGLLLSLFFGFVPMVIFSGILYWLDRYEKEPGLLLGIVFTWGALVASATSFLINTLFGMGFYWITGSELAAGIATGSISAPIIEESIKGLAVLLIFIFYRREFDTIMDGIVIAGITALGFAASENVYYIYNYGFLEGGYQGLFHLIFIRVILVGWQHPFYTAFLGIGLAFARFQPRIIVQALLIFLGWGLAVSTHAVHNIIASLVSGPGGLVFGTIVDWFGWFLMFLFILWSLHREKEWIKIHLLEEVGMGTITSQQYRTAASPQSQTAARLRALFSGKYTMTHNFYQTAAEIAYKKEQRLRMGEEHGNTKDINRLRGKLRALSSDNSS